MQCPSCGFDNPQEMKFCGGCGVRLKNLCPSCGFDNPPRFKFCGECGTPLTEQTPAPRPPTSPAAGEPVAGDQKPGVRAKPAKEKPKREKRGRAKSRKPTAGQPSRLSARREAPEAERRQLTLMFCDLVGSTALSEQLDPEELREVVRAYQEVCAGAIRRFEGHIARYVGDGLLIYFGYPVAHEDDAQRAAQAGLGIVAELPQLNTRLQQTVGALYRSPLQVRIGIHTGLAVVGEMGGGEYRDPMAVVGDTPNIAARMQEIAKPNTVVISAATHRLIQGYFACQSLGSYTPKGLSQPMEVYRVLQESGAQSRFEVAITTGLIPLVGREEEVGLLLKRWERAKEGEGQVVMLSGEAGIGKSRLVQELRDQVVGKAHTRLEYRCSPYHQNSAFYSVIDHLQWRLELSREDSPQKKLSKLERALEQYGFSLEEMVPLFASLLSVPLPDGRYPLLNLTPQRQKQKTLEALLAWLLKEAEKQAVLLVWEDLHWADPSTLELLSLLIDQAPTARILTLLTFRPEFNPPWATRSHLSQVTLSRLPHKQIAEMVKRVTGDKALPAEVLQQVAAKTDGVPLFVEELTKMVLESGLLRERNGHYELTGPLPPLAIPATLQDSLMARLDRLATVKEVAQLGATLGREFTYELIQAVSPLHEATLQRELAVLVEAELVYRRGLLPQASYIFKHALIQDAAYQSLLRSKRQQYHTQIAQVLTARFPETAETQPELLAHHYTEAGLFAQAIPYWQKAGERAAQRSANVEAVGHLSKGLELLRTLPNTPVHIQQELMLQITLGSPLMATKGWAAPEVEQAYTRARELCQQVGETPQLFPVLWGLWGFYVVRAELKTARELAEQCFNLAQSVQDQDLLIGAHLALGTTFFYLGEFILARDHLEQSIALYNSQKHRSLAPFYAQDPGVFCLIEVATLSWYLGYPDQAVKSIHAAITLAQELPHLPSLGGALGNAAWIYRLRREVQAVWQQAETAMTLSTEQGFPLWLAMGTFFQGWVLTEQGQGEKGIGQMRQGLIAWQATGAELARSGFLAFLAEAYGNIGRVEEGLTVLAEALDVVNRTGERHYEAELYRLKGEFLLAQEGKKGEECFRQALDIAHRQQAKSLELRAVMSLSRLWQRQGKKEEARQLLAETYSWFTEGFDTADLKEAKKLLAELS